MTESVDDTPEPLVTLTHARLRAAQGDLKSARRILARLLERRPEDPEAQRLLRLLPEGPEAPGPSDEAEALPPPVEPDAALLSRRFRRELGGGAVCSEDRIHRLQRWLEAIRSRGENHHA